MTTPGTDPVAAYLAELNKRTALRQQSHEITVRLLAAIKAVLALTDNTYVMLSNHETGHPEPVAWDLDPADVRETIARELLGESSRAGAAVTGTGP